MIRREAIRIPYLLLKPLGKSSNASSLHMWVLVTTYDSWTYIQLEDDTMAQSTFWCFMHERFRSQELYWEFFPCPVSQLTCLCCKLKAWRHLPSDQNYSATAVRGFGFPVPVPWVKQPSVSILLFPLFLPTFLFEKNLYVGKKEGKLPLKVNPMVEQALVTQ